MDVKSLDNDHLRESLPSLGAGGQRGVCSPSDGVAALSPMFGAGDHGRATCPAMTALKPSKRASQLQYQRKVEANTKAGSI